MLDPMAPVIETGHKDRKINVASLTWRLCKSSRSSQKGINMFYRAYFSQNIAVLGDSFKAEVLISALVYIAKS